MGMQAAVPDSQVETHLVDLLDFDKFALIKMLVQNRMKVVWCMRLNRAQSDEEHTRIQVCQWARTYGSQPGHTGACCCNATLISFYSSRIMSSPQILKSATEHL